MIAEIINIRFCKFFTMWLIAAAFTFTGCDSNVVFEENIQVDVNGWNTADFQRYSFNISDTSIPYNFYIDIRNSVQYPYSNIFLFIRTRLPDDNWANDTLDLWLSDPEGKWLGKGIGKYRDNRILVMPSFRFPMQGEYFFEIEHAMREPDLKGIASTGIRVERATK